MVVLHHMVAVLFQGKTLLRLTVLRLILSLPAKNVVAQSAHKCIISFLYAIGASGQYRSVLTFTGQEM